MHIVPPTASATTAIAPGMAFAVNVVPSSGSRAIIDLRAGAGDDLLADEEHRASSRSPSPITTVPWMSSWSKALRIASTAACRRPSRRRGRSRRPPNAAAASVTRATSMARVRLRRALVFMGFPLGPDRRMLR